MTSADKLPEPDLSGQTLDRYHLLRRIGVGGMGAVYEAEHTRLRKRFAVKLLRHELATNELSRKRFLREARAASAVSHPHIVAISDFGETEDGHVFFVMDLLAGKDLHDVLESERVLTWPRTRAILLQVTAALQAAHEQDIIHRDIKPSNVFLADIPGKGDEDFVKVLDFGIAKLSGTLDEATAKLTSTDEIFGTVAYMAPEMAVGKNDDPRSDVYAVGVMMYRMLTGMLPYTEGNAFQILSQHLHSPIPSPRETNPSISEAVEAIVLRAMAKEPDGRFATMEALNRALRRGTIEATEILAGAHAVLQTVALREPAVPRYGPDIDKTTPLPAKGAGVELAQATEMVSSLLHPSPSSSSDSVSLTKDAHRLGGSAAVAPGLADTIRSPRDLQTGQSKSTVVEGSGWPSQPLPSIAQTVAVSPSAPIAVGDPTGPKAPKILDPTVVLESGSSSRTAGEDEESPHGELVDVTSQSTAVADETYRGSLGKSLVAVGAVAVGVVIGFFLLGERGEGRSIEPQVGVNSSAMDTEHAPALDLPDVSGARGSKIESPTEFEVGSPESAAPAADLDAEPVVERATDVGAELAADTNDEPAVEPGLEPSPQPKATKTSRSRATRSKPKTDKEVVNALKARIASRCKDQLSGKVKVKVEGVITSAGRVEGLLVTPADGLGGCEKIVNAAKFDPSLGVRPMPRFSVQP